MTQNPPLSHDHYSWCLHRKMLGFGGCKNTKKRRKKTRGLIGGGFIGGCILVRVGANETPGPNWRTPIARTWPWANPFSWPWLAQREGQAPSCTGFPLFYSQAKRLPQTSCTPPPKTSCTLWPGDGFATTNGQKQPVASDKGSQMHPILGFGWRIFKNLMVGWRGMALPRPPGQVSGAMPCIPHGACHVYPVVSCRLSAPLKRPEKSLKMLIFGQNA